MSFFDEMAVTASELLLEFGQPVEFSYEEDAVYDPVLMVETGGTTGTVTVNAYPDNYGQMEVSDTILSSDIKLLCEKMSTIPKAGWSCIIESEVYRVMSTESVGLVGNEVIHFVQLRK